MLVYRDTGLGHTRPRQASIHFLLGAVGMGEVLYSFCPHAHNVGAFDISVALLGGSFSSSRFLDLNSSQHKAGMVFAPPELYDDQTDFSMGRTSLGSSDGSLQFQHTKHPPYMLLRRQVPFGPRHTHQPRQSSRYHVNKHQSRHPLNMIYTIASSTFSVMT